MVPVQPLGSADNGGGSGIVVIAAVLIRRCILNDKQRNIPVTVFY